MSWSTSFTSHNKDQTPVALRLNGKDPSFEWHNPRVKWYPLGRGVLHSQTSTNYKSVTFIVKGVRTPPSQYSILPSPYL